MNSDDGYCKQNGRNANKEDRENSGLPIITKRLMLAPYRSKFFNELYNLKQLPTTHRYNYTTVPSKDEVLRQISELTRYNYRNPHDRMELAILLKESDIGPEKCSGKYSGMYIGFIGLKGHNYIKDSTAEVFYTIHPDYFSQGYGTEAVNGLLDFCFNYLELHRVWAGATCENIGSLRVMEKVGMRKESHWIGDRPKPGRWIDGKGYETTDQWEDGFGYAILRDEYQKLNKPVR